MSTAYSQSQGGTCRFNELYDDQSKLQIARIKEHYSRDQADEDAQLEQERDALDLSIAQWVPRLPRHDSVLDTPPATQPNPDEARRTAVTARLTALRYDKFRKITTTHAICEQGCPKKKSDPQSHLSTTQGSVVSGPSAASASGEADSNV
jgi:hypothetical protein